LRSGTGRVKTLLGGFFFVAKHLRIVCDMKQWIRPIRPFYFMPGAGHRHENGAGCLWGALSMFAVSEFRKIGPWSRWVLQGRNGDGRKQLLFQLRFSFSMCFEYLNAYF
jgi:hypothetical protein